MSGPSVLGPQLVAAERGSLVLTDISGYTSYLLGTELEHAQDVLSDLIGVVVSSLQPPLHVSKLEGDAVFSYALDGVCGASTLLDTIEHSYFAFRSRQRDIAHATSCTCEACKQIPTLDLKFLVHHGSFVRRTTPALRSQLPLGSWAHDPDACVRQGRRIRTRSPGELVRFERQRQ